MSGAKNGRLMQYIILGILVSLWVTLTSCGREKPHIVEIAKEVDDGVVVRERGGSGYYTGGNGRVHGLLTVGVFSFVIGQVFESRALLRFDIHSWKGEDVTLHLYCDSHWYQGNPSVDIYVVEDFGLLPTQRVLNWETMWNIIANGTKVNSSPIKPTKGEWLTVTIPATVMEDKQSEWGCYIGIVVKLHDESISPSVVANFSSYSQEKYRPYIEW